MTGRDYCKVHGGKALRGIANTQYGKVKASTSTLPGQYSKYIPTKLAADYRKAQHDPERLSLLHEISTWTAREQELLRRLQPHDAGATWQTVAHAWEQITDAKHALDQAQAHRDLEGMRTAYAAFSSAIAAGTKGIAQAQLDYGLWREIKACHEMLLHLRAQEHKRLLDLQRYWNSEQVTLRWGQFLHALWEAATAKLPPETIRPFLVDFQYRIRSIEAEFHAMSTAETPEEALPTLEDHPASD